MDRVKVNSKLGLLSLLNIKGVGPAASEKIALETEYFEELYDHIRSVEGLSLRVKETLSDREELRRALSKAEKIVKDCEKEEIDIITLYDEQYPQLLKKIPNKPLVLYAKGKLKKSIKNIACVGTRDATEFGEKVGSSLSGYFAEDGWSIISGLAIGIDSISHEGALKVGGHTVAILANGLDSVYPKKNLDLAERILVNGGALLSEYPPGAKAFPQNLVMRDRLQSGMSCATFVVQTGVKGGTMHTVEFSLMQGRRVFCPVAKGIHREHEKYEGVITLLERDVEHFLSKVKRKPELIKKVPFEWLKEKVASPIENKDEYPKIKRILLNEVDRLEKELVEYSRSNDKQLELI